MTAHDRRYRQIIRDQQAEIEQLRAHLTAIRGQATTALLRGEEEDG